MEKKNHDQKQKIATGRLSTKLSLTIRVLVGFYLLYTAYQLFPGATSAEEQGHLLLTVFMVLFVIIGFFLIIVSARSLLQGRYVGGELDAGADGQSDYKEDKNESSKEL